MGFLAFPVARHGGRTTLNIELVWDDRAKYCAAVICAGATLHCSESLLAFVAVVQELSGLAVKKDLVSEILRRDTQLRAKYHATLSAFEKWIEAEKTDGS
jgi:hypothetical protein